MSRLLVVLLGFWLADPAPQHETATATSAATVSYEQAGVRMAAARVKNWASGYMQDGPSINGSGTLAAIVGDRGLVLTAGHLFEDKIGPITVEFNDGQRSGARILALDTKLDIAALWIFAPKNIRPIPIGKHDPNLGQQVEIWGYGPKRFRSFLARISPPIPMDGDIPRSLIAAQGVTDHQVTIPGDSGGAMICDGCIVGVHWGYRGTEDDPRQCVHALGCDMLNAWLQRELDPTLLRNAAFSQN